MDTQQIFIPKKSISFDQQEKVMQKILGLDLGQIKKNMMQELSWDQVKIDEVEVNYKWFLSLIAIYPASHVPTSDIDEMWHAHILDTKKYMYDCNAIFGYYIHHAPEYRESEENSSKKMIEALQLTAKLFEVEFDVSDYAVKAGNCIGEDCTFSKCTYTCSSENTPDPAVREEREKAERLERERKDREYWDNYNRD